LSIAKSKLTTVTVGRTNDWASFIVKTNLGDILKEGNSVQGYDLTSLNFNTDFDTTDLLKSAPDIILVKKIFPDLKTKS